MTSGDSETLYAHESAEHRTFVWKTKPRPPADLSRDEPLAWDADGCRMRESLSQREDHFYA
jgi:hypothetical protein